MKVSVYIASSLDGCIAGKNGEIDWLHNPAYSLPGEDFGYSDFMQSVDVIAMGKNTFEKVLEFSEWPFAGKRVVVLSRSLAALPAGVPAQLSNETPAAFVVRLRGEGAGRVYVDGGRLISSFLAAGLVTDLTLTRIPILLGEGLPLFSGLPNRLPLQHIATRTWSNGFVQSSYGAG